MKNTFILFLLLGSFFACKKNISKNTVQTNNKPIVQIDSTDNLVRDSIEIFIIGLGNTKPKISKELLTLNENLSKSFKDYSKITTTGILKGYLTDIKEKELPKVLEMDLENPNFTKAKNMQVSFLSKKQEDQQGLITLEQWQFESEKEAISCIDSFKNYKGQTIHYMSTNWIWVQQKNKLYLISTIEFRPSAEPMQTIKQNLIDILKKQGEFNIIEMD